MDPGMTGIMTVALRCPGSSARDGGGPASPLMTATAAGINTKIWWNAVWTQSCHHAKATDHLGTRAGGSAIHMSQAESITSSALKTRQTGSWRRKFALNAANVKPLAHQSMTKSRLSLASREDVVFKRVF